MKMKLCILGACILYISLPLALALQCQECTNFPGNSGFRSCDSQPGVMTCGPYLDRCMTVRVSYPFLGSFEIRNCSVSISCDPNSEFYVCNFAGTSGCFVDCCEGDMCNSVSEDAAYRRSSFLHKLFPELKHLP